MTRSSSLWRLFHFHLYITVLQKISQSFRRLSLVCSFLTKEIIKVFVFVLKYRLVFGVSKYLGSVWYIYLKIKNCSLEVFVKIYVNEKMYKNMCNIGLKIKNDDLKTNTKHPLYFCFLFWAKEKNTESWTKIAKGASLLCCHLSYKLAWVIIELRKSWTEATEWWRKRIKCGTIYWVLVLRTFFFLKKYR